jgi:hypothetical protein
MPMTYARVAAVLTGVYGVRPPTIPVALYLRGRGQLPTFFDLFEIRGSMVGAARAEHVHRTPDHVPCRERSDGVGRVAPMERIEPGAVLSLALLPIEAVFWVGFALPIPWLLGAVRVVLIVLAWSSRA